MSPTTPLAKRPRTSVNQPTRGYRVFQGVNGVILTLVVLVTLYPFVNIIARSFSGERQIRAGEVTLWPKGFNLTTYKIVFQDSTFWRNYGNSVFYTVVSTVVAMALTTCYAYVLSKRNLKGRGVLVGLAVFTMFFTGGLIPHYVLVTSLGLKNSVWAIALPHAISVFNLLVMKAFFESLPAELEEAAEIDGLSTYGVLLRIVLPLSKAVIATMVLFYSVSFWNSWFSAYLYMDRTELMPATVYLRNLISGATTGGNAGAGTEQLSQVGANIQAVTIVLTALPILSVYPFVQRYFVSGVMLGAVKG